MYKTKIVNICPHVVSAPGLSHCTGLPCHVKLGHTTGLCLSEVQGPWGRYAAKWPLWVCRASARSTD
jgi:hypothetical protein